MPSSQNKNNKFINEGSIINLVAFGPFIFIPAVIMLFSFLIIDASNNSFEKNVEKIEYNLHNTYSKSIKTKVESIVDYIAYHKSTTKEDMRLRLQTRVENALKIAKALNEKYKNTKTKKEIKELIVESIRPLTWNDGESFIWIMDYKGYFYLAPEYLRHLEGTSIIDFKDATGKEVIKEEIDICKSIGNGFILDTFTHPKKDIDKQYQQLAFVKKLGFYNWYMGSSEYIDTAKKLSDKKLLKNLKKIDAKNKNYVYILKKDGTVLMHSAIPDMEGKNLATYANGKTAEIYSMIKEKTKDNRSGYISYKWNNPKTQMDENKYTYIQVVPDSDWIVATGYYESNIKNNLANQSKSLYESHYMKLTNIIYASIFLLFISLLISYFVSRFIKKSFRRYHKQINLKASELRILNNSLESKVQERTEQLLIATKELEQIAKTDFLTKAHSRYSIIEILQQEIKRSERYKTALSVVMVDIDWFKKINDEFGHAKGDKVLVDMVDLFKLNLRGIDYVGRYGGEEFLLVLPNTSIEDAKITLERMMQNIATFDFGIGRNLTISIGLVEYKNGDSMDLLLKRADDLLYKSKENGRNLLSV